MVQTMPRAKQPKRTLHLRSVKGPVVEIPKGYVIVSRKWLEKLLEDASDATAIRQGRRGKKIALDDVVRELKRDGLL